MGASSRLDVLLIEPWYHGSHRSWADGWAAHSSHCVTVLGNHDERWRRSLLTTPLEMSRRLESVRTSFDCLVASTPIDLAALLGQTRRRLGHLPVVLFAHETQIGYPSGPQGGRAQRAAEADWTSMVAADLVLVASEHHRRSLTVHLPPFVNATYEEGPTSTRLIDRVLSKIEVVPVGISAPDPPAVRRDGPPRILWNHRWAHDKAPGRFVHALARLSGEQRAFEVLLLGAVERGGRTVHRRALRSLGQRVLHHGYLGRDAYRDVLVDADIVVSTADHEFFGIGVLEAMAAGSRPVLPNRLTYPDMIPHALHPELLYDGDLADALRPLLQGSVEDLHTHRSATVAAARRFSWDTVAPTLDARLTSLRGQG